MVRFFDKYSNICVLRTSMDSFKDLWFALTCMTTISKNNVTLRVLKVCGSTRTCTAYLEDLFDKVICKEISSVTECEKQRELFIKNLMNFET